MKHFGEKLFCYLGNSSSNPSPPPGETTAVNSCRVYVDVPVRTAISKRKVASAPAAPAYKGNMAICFLELETAGYTKVINSK